MLMMRANTQMMQGMKEEINGMNNKMEANTNKMEKMRGEMRQMGQCLQAGIMATPRAATNELKGECTGGRRQGDSGDVLGEKREGDGDGDREGKINGVDGDVHE